MSTADLLFALDEKLDVYGKLAAESQKCAYGLIPAQAFLVVGDTLPYILPSRISAKGPTPIHPGIRRLDIVMVVEQHCLALSCLLFAKHHRVAAVGMMRARILSFKERF